MCNIYLFPGQGSDKRLFDEIKISGNFQLHHIEYPFPVHRISLKAYANSLASQIDNSQPFILVGVSMGGMICSELADILKPEKVIVISSAKYCKELPFRYRFQKAIPLYRLVPKKLMKAGAQILQPIVEPDRRKFKTVFISMLKSKSPDYYKRTVKMIIHWDKTVYNDSIIHIHGTKDHTIPIRNVVADFIVDNGSHMMTLTNGKEISIILNKIFDSK